MLNALRLKDGVARNSFSERTGLPSDAISAQVDAARNEGLLEDGQGQIKATEKGGALPQRLVTIFHELILCCIKNGDKRPRQKPAYYPQVQA